MHQWKYIYCNCFPLFASIFSKGFASSCIVLTVPLASKVTQTTTAGNRSIASANINYYWVSIKSLYDTLQDLEFIKWTLFQKNKVWIYHMLCISFNGKLNGELVFRLINAKHLLFRPYILLTWSKNQNKKDRNISIDI